MTGYLSRLQILRFVAAGMVLFGHAQVELGKLPGLGLEHLLPSNKPFFVGGVDMFFVLSGFIMYRIAREDFGRPGAGGRFLLRRLVRIGPPYWFFTTAMLAAALLLPGRVAHSDVSLLNAVASYLFIPAPNAYGETYPVLILGWTLNFEMLFYVIFAFALRFSRARGLALVFAAVGMLAAVGMASPVLPASFAFWCQPIVLEFLFGILLAQVHAAGWRCGPALGTCAALLGFALLYAGSSLSPPSPLWGERWLYMGLPALLICAAAALTPEPVAMGRTRRLLILAGDASYALYLSHPFTLAVLAAVWPRGMNQPWLFLGLALALAIAVSIALHLAVERRVTNFLNRWLTLRPAGRHMAGRTTPAIPARASTDLGAESHAG